MNKRRRYKAKARRRRTTLFKQIDAAANRTLARLAAKRGTPVTTVQEIEASLNVTP